MSSVFTMLAACFRPKNKRLNSQSGKESLLNASSAPAEDSAPAKDELLWSIGLSNSSAGEFSIAAVQANNVIEDQSQVESGLACTFIGIYDGHGGPQTAQFLNERMYLHFQKVLTEEGGVVSVDGIKKSFALAEEEFVETVRSSWEAKPQLAAVGSCGLVGVITGETLYVASLGDSRAVLGTYRKANGVVAAVQLSTDHNANYQAIRQELTSRYPDEKDIVVHKGGVWRVKGIIQVSRSFGDVYLKGQEFQREPLFPRFRLPEPLKAPVLLAEPTVIVRVLRQPDQFVIFASDGLWEHISNQEAVDMVHAYPRQGIARRLVVAAVMRAARKREMSYADLKALGRGKRRMFHDDISVVVLFFNHELLKKGAKSTAATSVKAGQAVLPPDVHSAEDVDMEEEIKS